MALPLARSARLIAIAAVLSGLGSGPVGAQQTEAAADEPARIQVRIENRKVVGDQVIRLTQGQLVEIIWTTDEAAELHMHGYDIRVEISPDASVAMLISAHATGRFAVTSHGFGGEHGHGHETLAYIEVHPK